MIKMSIYTFIFEMRHVFEILTSDSQETHQQRRRLRVRWMWTVITLQIFSIIVIEVYNYLYLIELRTDIKSGFLGYIYQAVKFAVLCIDLGMILMLYLTFRGLQEARAKSKITTKQTRSPIGRKDNSGSHNRFWKLWIVALLVTNTLWIILRAFVRNLSAVLETRGLLFFNYIQQYRYAI